MKSIIKNTIIAISLLSSSPLMAASESYVLDPTHTNVVWSANHFGFSNVSGKFAKVEGQLILDEVSPENSKVSVTISTASVITGIEKFDAHLKSDAFFDVEKFPNATFQSTKVEITEAGKKAYDDAKKRIDYKDKNQLGTGRGRAVLNQDE
jgi:polyisoprenoid-binding protein YceI